MAEIKSFHIDELERTTDTVLRDLRSAAEGSGILYLDLSGSSKTPLRCYVQKCYEIFDEVYKLPLDEKLCYDIDNLGTHKLNGYKPAGRNTGAARDKKDGFEAYLLPRDGVCNPTTDGAPLMAPQTISNQLESIKRTMTIAHDICLTILRALAKALNLDSKFFERYHRPNQNSTSALGVLKYVPLGENSTLVGHTAHTDVGSLTLLFTTAPGLQIGDLERSVWYDVEPKDGHAIVNFGDSLRFMSQGRVHSCVHRVIPPKPDTAGEADQKSKVRFSCAYFLRPELSAPLMDDSGVVWESIQWHARKYRTFRAPLVDQEQDAVMTGKYGNLGLWTKAE